MKVNSSISFVSRRKYWEEYFSLLQRVFTLLSKNYFFHMEVLFVDNREMKQINFNTRKKDGTTNILSFPMGEWINDKIWIGEIIISIPKVKKEAKELHKKMEYYLVFLFIHGFLHLLHYDHETEKDAKIMENLEKKIMNNVVKKVLLCGNL